MPSITEERLPPALTLEQVDALVKACPRSRFTGARDRALILLISSSGVRAAEAMGLTESDLVLDSDQRYVVVRGKGDRYREAACSHQAALAIRAYLRARRLVDAASSMYLGCQEMPQRHEIPNLDGAPAVLTRRDIRTPLHDAPPLSAPGRIFQTLGLATCPG